MGEEKVEPADKAVSDLATATACGKVVPLHNGKEITVKPLRFMQTVYTLKLLPPLLGAIRKLQNEREEIGLTDLLEIAPDAMLKVAMLCTEQNSVFFDTLETDEGLDIFTAVWEVNQDFFVKNVLPRLKSLGVDDLLVKIRRAGLSESTS